MASNSSLLKMTEETFEYICTPCSEDDLIKEALKYCVDCQHYCCKDCLSYHRRIPSLKGHTFLDNSSVTPQGQPRSSPAFPTKQCSKHLGIIMNMYCKTHDVICCYAGAAEDHRACKDMISVSDNIDRLYNKTDTSKATSELSDILYNMALWQMNTNDLLQQLQDSKVSAIKAVSDCRIEMEKFLKTLEQVSIREIEDEYKKLESQILAERKSYKDSIDNLKNLQQLLAQASENIAQQFVCSKLAEKKCNTIGDNEMKREKLNHAEVKFVPSEELKSRLEKMKNLGEASVISSRRNNMIYKATKICDMNVRLQEDMSTFGIYGSCIVDDTIIFTDYANNKLKRYDILSLSLIDYCDVPRRPCGVCRVGDEEVAVACRSEELWNGVVQFVSIDGKLSPSRSIKMKHQCYGIAYNNDKLYITNESKSLYMYDMSGNILKTVTRDNRGQPLFERTTDITINETNDRLFVADAHKGLVCFNAQCDYVETITDIRPSCVCIDGYGNVIVAQNYRYNIVQCGRDGQKQGTIVHNTIGHRCVCIHHGHRKMFLGLCWSDKVRVYRLSERIIPILVRDLETHMQVPARSLAAERKGKSIKRKKISKRLP